jgi:hypothetical protein
VEQAAHGLDRIAGVGWLAADPLERLVDGVCIGEDVMCGLPVGMLVGGPKGWGSALFGFFGQSKEITDP